MTQRVVYTKSWGEARFGGRAVTRRCDKSGIALSRSQILAATCKELQQSQASFLDLACPESLTHPRRVDRLGNPGCSSSRSEQEEGHSRDIVEPLHSQRVLVRYGRHLHPFHPKSVGVGDGWYFGSWPQCFISRDFRNFCPFLINIVFVSPEKVELLEPVIVDLALDCFYWGIFKAKVSVKYSSFRNSNRVDPAYLL